MIRTGNKSDLKDGYFLGRSTTDIIADLAAGVYTLAVISALQISELIRIGWENNPAIDRLYKCGSSGVWVAKEQTADGQCPTEELRNYHLTLLGKTNPTYNLIDQTTISQLTAYYAQHRVAVIPITVGGGGAQADTVIVAAVTGYKSCCKILGIISSITEAATVLDFEDEDNTDLEGNLSGGFAMNFTASTMNTQLSGLHLRGTAASKSAEVDVSSFGAGGTILIYLEYWYEA